MPNRSDLLWTDRIYIQQIGFSSNRSDLHTTDRIFIQQIGFTYNRSDLHTTDRIYKRQIWFTSNRSDSYQTDLIIPKQIGSSQKISVSTQTGLFQVEPLFWGLLRASSQIAFINKAWLQRDLPGRIFLNNNFRRKSSWQVSFFMTSSYFHNFMNNVMLIISIISMGNTILHD